MPTHPYDAARLAAIALMQRLIDVTGLNVSTRAREALEVAVTDDLISKPIPPGPGITVADHDNEPSGSGIYPSAQTEDIVALSEDAAGRPH